MGKIQLSVAALKKRNYNLPHLFHLHSVNEVRKNEKHVNNQHFFIEFFNETCFLLLFLLRD